MRLKVKYKIFLKQDFNNVKFFPKRILKFKRSKWNILKEKLQKNYINVISFIKKLELKFPLITILKKSKSKAHLQHPSLNNKKKIKSFLKLNKIKFFKHNLTLTKLKSWDRIKNHFRDGLKLNQKLTQETDFAVSSTILKKIVGSISIKDYFDLYSTIFIYHTFRLDLILWNLKFFTSVYQARQFINDGKIFVNNKQVYGGVFLKSGDIITCSLNLKNFNLIKTSFFNQIGNYFMHRVEIDYYTKTIIIIKGFYECNIEDLDLLFSQHNESLTLKNFLMN